MDEVWWGGLPIGAGLRLAHSLGASLAPHWPASTAAEVSFVPAIGRVTDALAGSREGW